MQFNYADDTQLYLSMKPVRIGSSSLDIFFLSEQAISVLLVQFLTNCDLFSTMIKKKKNCFHSSFPGQCV